MVPFRRRAHAESALPSRIEANKRIDSHGIQSTELLGSIAAEDINKVKAVAQQVPPQQCQRYVVALAHELEKKGFVRSGEAVRLNGKVQMSERAQVYATQNPVDHPSGAYVPASSANTRPSKPAAGGVSQPQAVAQAGSRQKASKPKEKGGCCIVM